ncbi:hypothetical protein HMN09_01365400 [Mycena chlorophos]|uniref:Uncharacterized protein n=1 Tax=Mycena chlorophos TaxID=658473 RepID=A0A8H6S049_MYCCL|nr:hypothetical protein HMN09_01365400 [Mycena chlorophos]
MVVLKESPIDTELHGQPPSYTATVSSPTSSSSSGSSGDEAFIYYALCDHDGNALSPTTTFDPEYPSLGRIALRTIPPPRTAAVLKRCAANAEGLVDAILYAHASAEEPLPESGRIGSGEEGTMRRPYMLFGARTRAGNGNGNGAAADEYFYYRIYSSTGEGTSTHAFKQNDPSLGRIPRARLFGPGNHVPSYGGTLTMPCSSALFAIAQAEVSRALYSADVYPSTEATETVGSRAELAVLGPAVRADGLGGSEATALVLVTKAEAEPGYYNAHGSGRGYGERHGHGPSRGRGRYPNVHGYQPQQHIPPFPGHGFPFDGFGPFGPGWIPDAPSSPASFPGMFDEYIADVQRARHPLAPAIPSHQSMIRGAEFPQIIAPIAVLGALLVLTFLLCYCSRIPDREPRNSQNKDWEPPVIFDVNAEDPRLPGKLPTGNPMEWDSLMPLCVEPQNSSPLTKARVFTMICMPCSEPVRLSSNREKYLPYLDIASVMVETKLDAHY